MQPDDTQARQRKGAISEVELDGSVTLYGIEDWTQLGDSPVLEIAPISHRPRGADAPDSHAGGVVSPSVP